MFTANIEIRELKQWKIVNCQAQKVVALAYRRWSFTRGFNCKAFTGKILVFWICGRLREVVAYEGSTVPLVAFVCSREGIDGYVPLNRVWHRQVLSYYTSTLLAASSRSYINFSFQGNSRTCATTYILDSYNLRSNSRLLLSRLKRKCFLRLLPAPFMLVHHVCGIICPLVSYAAVLKVVTQRSYHFVGGALHDDPKNGCEGDYWPAEL